MGNLYLQGFVFCFDKTLYFPTYQLVTNETLCSHIVLSLQLLKWEAREPDLSQLQLLWRVSTFWSRALLPGCLILSWIPICYRHWLDYWEPWTWKLSCPLWMKHMWYRIPSMKSGRFWITPFKKWDQDANMWSPREETGWWMQMRELQMACLRKECANLRTDPGLKGRSGSTSVFRITE